MEYYKSVTINPTIKGDIMRIEFGNHIDLCSRVTHSSKSKLLLITSGISVYTVDMGTVNQAEEAYEEILIKGYYDVSGYQYSN